MQAGTVSILHPAHRSQSQSIIFPVISARPQRARACVCECIIESNCAKFLARTKVYRRPGIICSLSSLLLLVLVAIRCRHCVSVAPVPIAFEPIVDMQRYMRTGRQQNYTMSQSLSLSFFSTVSLSHTRYNYFILRRNRLITTKDIIP